MKTKLLSLLLLLALFAGFAQGKITFVNDSNHAYLLFSSREPITGTLLSGITLVAGLYAGTSSSSLTLQSTTVVLAGIGNGLTQPGQQSSRSTFLTVPGGAPQWFRILIWDSTLSPPDANLLVPNPFGSVGWSDFFQATPGTSLTYPSIMPGSPANSTIPLGPIYWPTIPEPSLLALGVLGLLLLHRAVHRAVKEPS